MGEQNILLKKTQKPSYVQRAYDGIRNLIIEEEISPGELLSENQLAAYLNMSRTPVREAIRRLQAEGFLESRKGLGTFLKPLTTKDVRNIYEVRKAMELIACETSIYQITDEEIEAVRASLMSLLARHEAGEEIDRMEFSKLDGQCHDLIVQKSSNGYIKILMDQIYFNVDRYRIISFHVSLDLEESTRQHLVLLDCLKERNLEKLKAALSEHLDWSLSLLFKHLEL